MVETCNLKFKMSCKLESEYADEIGKDLAVFLRESFFNGEDVLDVKYCGHEVIS